MNSYGKDMVAVARTFDPVIGCNEEIRNVFSILCRHTHNNAVLIGEPGVGKTAIVEGIAQKILNRDVPSDLQDARLTALNMIELRALNKRLKTFLDEVEDAKGKVILFIEDIHLVLDADRNNGAMDVANLLMPKLGKGRLRCIGATTLEDYRKYVKKDEAFMRRFQHVYVAEPSVADTVTILRGLKEKYETYHGVSIQDEALVSAAQLSSRYITGWRQPDKSIDLLEEACVDVTNSHSPPEGNVIGADEINNIIALKKKRGELMSSLQDADRNIDMDRVVATYNDLQKIHAEIFKLEGKNANLMQVSPEHISKVVSRMTGIPVTKVGQNQKERLLGLAGQLQLRVIGQDHACINVANAIKKFRSGMSRKQQPVGSFLFLGCTGVGKTELAKALAEQLFDDEKLIVRLDMSEYMEAHSVSRLFGAPPGYVGHKGGGQLTEKIRQHLYNIVLFDKIEKGHPTVLNTLHQVLDDGKLTDSTGRIVDCTNTIIIMTSNIGAQYFTADSDDDLVSNELKRHFRPELLSRIDEIIVFDPISEKGLGMVARNLMKNVVGRLKERGISLDITEAAIDVIVSNCSEKAKDYGARPLRRWIERHIVTKLANMLLEGEIGERVYIDAAQDKMELVYNP